MEFLFSQRPGLGGMAALRPSVSQVPGKLSVLSEEKRHRREFSMPVIDPQHVMLALKSD